MAASPNARNALLDERVLGVLRDAGPLIAERIGAALGLDRLPVRRALGRLRQKGLVRLVGRDRSAFAGAASGPPGIWEAVASTDA